MTDTQPNPPEPEKPQPTAPPRQPSAVKSLTIQALRATIDLLEKAVEKLEAPEPAEPQPSLLAQAWERWVGVLGVIRSLLPASVSQKLPDWGLTGAIASLLALILWTSSAILSPKPPEVATVPPALEPAPPELVAPAEPEPVETLPEPEPILTPEQRLIASIQEQVAEVTADYAEGLIKSIQADFEGSVLAVRIGDEWYNLPESKQNKLATDMLKRSKELDFSKLDIVDLQGKSVARSPVIGSDMIILRRRLQGEDESISLK